MPNQRRDKRTGRFVSKADTPFAPRGPGIPGGWTAIGEQKSRKSKKSDLPPIIRSDPPKPDKNYFTRNLKATSALTNKLNKAQGGLPLQANTSPKVKLFLDAMKKQNKKTKKPEKKRSGNGEDKSNANAT